ncbi:phage antirepressor KilAC domain-containing protein [Nonomuraea sp. NPDC026600]|uniref:phage antirepressor KilAC domain-containing protein n=1 Tax=Nonomuraea sp. NPDC026600 TaxID=3155363 RepID=UPI0033FAC575
MDNSTLFDPEDDGRGVGTELQISPAMAASPFDALRQVDEEGEFWSGRDVMPHLDYEQWRRFVDSIERAMAALRNSGEIVQDHIAASGKITKNARGHRRILDDFRLSRHGAFLVAMNGDPRKPAIANAQAYFAQQTRKQELAEQALADAIDAPPSADLVNLRDVRALKQFHEMFGAALARIDEQAEQIQREQTGRMIEAAGRQAAEEEIAIIGPKAAAADHHRAADGLMTLSDFANKLNAWSVQNLGIKIKHKDVFDFLGEIGFICRGNTVRNNRPKSFATDRDFIREKETEYEDKNGVLRISYSSRLTPPGDGWAWDRAVTRLNDFGSLRKPMDGVA